jgi:hypothetical protein
VAGSWLSRQRGFGNHNHTLEGGVMIEPLDAAYDALEECLDSLDRTIEVGDISQTDKIWICRSIINALAKVSP